MSMGLYMFPEFSVHNTAHHTFAERYCLPDNRRGTSIGRHCSNPKNLLIGYLSLVMRLAAFGPLRVKLKKWARLSSSVYFIIRICLWRAFSKMIRITARRIITAMTHQKRIRPSTGSKVKCNFVSRKIAAMRLELTVSKSRFSLALTFLPFPAVTFRSLSG